MPRILFLICLSCIMIFSCGFSCTPPPPTSFTIQTSDAIGPQGTNPPPPGTVPIVKIPRPGTNVYGELVVNTQGPGAQGTLGYYDGTTNSFGLYQALNVIVPANWDHNVNFGYPQDPALDPEEPCIFPVVPPGSGIQNYGEGLFGSNDVPMANGDLFEWICYYEITQLPAGLSNFALQSSLPSTLTVSSNGVPLTTAGGYPQLYVYGEDTNGNSLFNTVTATSVAPNGASATFPFPTNADGTALAPSLYSAALVNNNSDGTQSPAGPSILSIGAMQQFTTPMGVGAQVVQYSSYSSDTGDPYGDGTCAGQTTYSSETSTTSYPVVTQYSLGNVNTNGTIIPVGSNPTAIVLYNEIDNSRYNQNGPCNYSGSDTTFMGNAVVANTGSNTVSILDLNANEVIATVTVGSNPSAITLSPDQSVAYVLNSGEGTLSSVSLSSYSQTAKVFVGSTPEAMAITPDGNIWVGGQGYLAQINTSLQVIGNYSTNGYSISSLSYNPGAAELVATAATASGSLVVQEINNSATSTNNALSVNAQRQIAILPSNSVGLYYSATAQHSAVPLMMPTGTLAGGQSNDNWLSVSGSTNGFTITDAIDHVDFMDGTAPGPITSISIDPSEYVAYLAIPDSNEVMTVYLPQ